MYGNNQIKFSVGQINKIVVRLHMSRTYTVSYTHLVFDVLGNLRLELAKQLGLLKKDDFKFLWVTEFPLLEYSEEEDRYVAMHHPFTMPMDEDLPLIDTNPGAVRAKAYDIVLNGTEMGGGSVRIHQADIQAKMFEVLGFTPELSLIHI